MTYDKIYSFLITSEVGSMNKAAEKLFISQQSLSHSIASMESELGQRLFLRSNRGVALTPFGAVFQLKARAVVEAMEDLNAACGLTTSGQKHNIVIGMPMSNNYSSMSAAMERALADYTQKSGIKIETMAVEGNSNQILYEMLLSKEIDVAYSHGPMNDEQIEKNVIQRLPLCLLLQKGHPLAEHKTVSFADLRNESFILPKSNSGLHSLIVQQCEANGFEPNVAGESGYAKKMIELVSRNCGIAILEKKSAREATRLYENLKGIAFTPKFEMQYYLAINRCNSRSAQLQSFIKAIAEQVKKCYHYLGI